MGVELGYEELGAECDLSLRVCCGSNRCPICDNDHCGSVPRLFIHGLISPRRFKIPKPHI